MPILFPRARLIVLTSAEELVTVRARLNAASIPFAVKTASSRGMFGRSADVRLASQPRFINSPVSGKNVYGAELSHLYYIYVRLSDRKRARQIIRI